MGPPPVTCTNTSGLFTTCLTLLPPPLREPSWSLGRRGPSRSCAASPRSKLSLPPLSPPSSSSSSSSANKRREATIEDTLAQLSALAGGKSEKSKGKAPSLHTMDQDKPILATPIKE